MASFCSSEDGNWKLSGAKFALYAWSTQKMWFHVLLFGDSTEYPRKVKPIDYLTAGPNGVSERNGEETLHSWGKVTYNNWRLTHMVDLLKRGTANAF